MRKKFNSALVLLIAALCPLWHPQDCAASWVDVPLDEVVWRNPVVVAGKIDAITAANPAPRGDEYKYDIARISVHEILKNDLVDYPIGVGDRLPVSMPARESKNLVSTAIRYEVGEEGIWILEFQNGQFWATYPKDRQPLDQKQRIQAFIKNPLTDADVITRRLGGRTEVDELRLDEPRVRDLSALAGVRIKTLDLKGTKIADFSPLEASGITHLNLYGTRTTNLQTLAGVKLTHLNLGNSLVSDLAPLSKLPLVGLYVHGSKVVDLSPLRGTSIQDLNIQNTGVSDLSPLAQLRLTHLFLEGSHVTDLTPLRNLPLVRIGFTASAITNGVDVLKGIKTLETINDQPADEFWKNH